MYLTTSLPVHSNLPPSSQGSFHWHCDHLMKSLTCPVLSSKVHRTIHSHYTDHIIFTLCSKCPPPVCAKISDVDKLKQRIKNKWAHLNHAVMERAVGNVAPVLEFALKANISRIWYKDDVIYYLFDTFWDKSCQSCLWLFNDSLKYTRKYCVDSSICHLKFPKVELAYILGEVGTLCIVLLSVYSYQFFIEINHIWQT